MSIDRRSVVAMLAGLPAVTLGATYGVDNQGEAGMYGLIGKMMAVDGKRDELSGILLEGLKDMPGNLIYVVANDPSDANALWITEVWTDSAAHQASLTLPSVQEAIQRGRPLIAGMERVAETQPVGGQGL